MEITNKLYDEVLDYTHREYNRMASSSSDRFDHIDIAHDVITDPEFSIEWRKLVKKHLFARLKHHWLHSVTLDRIDDVHFEKKYPCQGCHEEFFKNRFQSSYTLCNKCYRDKYKDRINANTRRWRKNNPDKVKQSDKEQSLKRKEENKNYMKVYRAVNRESISEKERQYRLENKERIKKRRREYYLRKGK